MPEDKIHLDGHIQLLQAVPEHLGAGVAIGLAALETAFLPDPQYGLFQARGLFRNFGGVVISGNRGQTTVFRRQASCQVQFKASDKPMQLAAFSEQEMRETEGAWLLNAAGASVGGFASAYGYMTHAAYSNRNASPSSVAWGLTKSIAAGAALGVIRPVRSIGGALGRLSISAGRGAVIGYGSGRGWW